MLKQRIEERGSFNKYSELETKQSQTEKSIIDLQKEIKTSKLEISNNEKLIAMLGNPMDTKEKDYETQMNLIKGKSSKKTNEIEQTKSTIAKQQEYIKELEKKYNQTVEKLKNKKVN